MWSVLSALLPRASILQVSASFPLSLSCSAGVYFAPAMSIAHAVPGTAAEAFRGETVCIRQVSGTGDVRLVSGVGGEGTSRMRLSGGKGLGDDGARRLAELLLEARPPLLSSLDLRHASVSWLLQFHSALHSLCAIRCISTKYKR